MPAPNSEAVCQTSSTLFASVTFAEKWIKWMGKELSLSNTLACPELEPFPSLN
jgi:hypothetical protein